MSAEIVARSRTRAPVQPVAEPEPDPRDIVLYERYRIQAADHVDGRFMEYGEEIDMQTAKDRATALWDAGAAHVRIIVETARLMGERRRVR